jgi:hypothetical protein
VRIGDVVRDVLSSVANQDSIPAAHGLIGGNVFGEFLVTPPTARRLRLDPLPGHRVGHEEIRDRTFSPEMEHFTRVYRFGHLLLVTTRFSDSREVQFVIDPGADRNLISYDMAAEASKVKVDDRMHLSGVGRGADFYQTGNLFLQFAGSQQKSLGMTSVDIWRQSRNNGTEVFLGLPLLTLFTLTIDYRGWSTSIARGRRGTLHRDTSS